MCYSFFEDVYQSNEIRADFRYQRRDYTEDGTLSTDLTSRANNALTDIFHLNI